MYHKMKDGAEILIRDMEDNHLINTMRMIERKAESGLTVRQGGGGPDIEDMWCDEDHLVGEDCLLHLGYTAYIDEARKRGLLWRTGSCNEEDVLTEVLKYCRGVGRYDLSSLYPYERQNAAYDMWKEIEERIEALLRRRGIEIKG